MRRCNTVLGLKGVDFLRNRFTNKGTAFSSEEREALGVRGLLPPQVETLSDQMDRYYSQFNLLDSPINRYQLLRGILDSNVTLYYALLNRYLKETLPIIYTPTVGEACQKYGSLYQKDHGLYISTEDIGRVADLVSNSRKSNIDVIVVTDGSRILGLGDLGANGMGISIGKCSLYVAGAGVHPGRVLPVMLDCGTNNEHLKNDPLYLGQRVSRVPDETFYGLLDEFMEAASKQWPNAVIQFEDFSNNHCFDMLERYQNKYRCFNDDIQGTGAVVSAGFVNAMRLSKNQDHKIVVFGAGSAASGVVNSIADLVTQTFKMERQEVIDRVYLVDSKGLVTKNRGDKLQKHKIPFAREDVPESESANLRTLEQVVKYVKPTALLGLAGVGPVFTEDIVKFMHSYCDRPIVFPLSNPTSKAECDARDAYRWTNGDAIVASGSPFPEVVVNGKICKPSQGNNMYIFPGIGLGVSIAQPKTISNEVLVEASRKLCEMISVSQMESQNILYPPLDEIRYVSKHIAVAIIRHLQKTGEATTKLPDNYPDILKLVDRHMYQPVYPDAASYIAAGRKPRSSSEQK